LLGTRLYEEDIPVMIVVQGGHGAAFERVECVDAHVW
jgi:hypothetical protein